jgi:uncharacterized membrane protein YeaQ/YmgE (transglycosylase-associated protein family)
MFPLKIFKYYFFTKLAIINQLNFYIMDGLLYTIIIGAVCGYIADVLMSDNGYGLIISIIIGIAGSFVGTWAFGQLGISVGSGWISDIIKGASGAIIILFILGIIKGGGRNRRR